MPRRIRFRTNLARPVTPNRIYAKPEARTRQRRARVGTGRVSERYFRPPSFYLDTREDSFYNVRQPRTDLGQRRMDIRALLLIESKYVRSNFSLMPDFTVNYRGRSLRWDMRTAPPTRLRETPSHRSEYADIIPQPRVIITDDERALIEEEYQGYEAWAMWTAYTGTPRQVTYYFLRKDARRWFWIRSGENKGSP